MTDYADLKAKAEAAKESWNSGREYEVAVGCLALLAENERLQRELAEAQKAWASEAEAHALAMEIIAELEEDELKLQAAYEGQLAEMRAALEEVARDAACACDAAYTSRGRHEPNAVCYLADVARAALASTPEVPDA